MGCLFTLFFPPHISAQVDGLTFWLIFLQLNENGIKKGGGSSY